MSYLDVPRISIAGRFYADPSTVDNDPVHYEVDCTRPSPWQTPQGLHEFKLVDCRLRSALDAAGVPIPDDPAIGAAVSTVDKPSAAKMVDLDVYQQGTSTIFGLRLQIALADGPAIVGAMDPATLNGVQFNAVLPKRGWGPQGSYGWGSYGGDSEARGVFQSVIRVDPKDWNSAASPALTRLRDASAVVDGKIVLSIRFTLDGYINNPVDPNYLHGRFVAAIGPYRAAEPLRCPGVRWLLAPTPPDQAKPTPDWFVPAFYPAPFKVDEARRTLVVDLSNSVATVEIGGPPVDLGTLRAEAPGAGAAEFAYSDQAYEDAAGICEVPLDDAQVAALRSGPLTISTSRADIGDPRIFRESPDGLAIAADDRVLRIPGEPGSAMRARVFASRWGRPAAGLRLNVQVLPVHGDTPGATVPPSNPGDTPSADGALACEIGPTGPDGFATASISIVKDPGRRTPQLDGQLYFLHVYEGDTPSTDQESLISVLAFSAYPVKTDAAWDEIREMMVPYMKIYPGMKEKMDLTDETTFAIYAKNPPFSVFYTPKDPNFKILDRITGGAIPFFLSRDLDDPRAMPVSRDLSPNRILTILHFIQNSYFPPAPPAADAPAGE